MDKASHVSSTHDAESAHSAAALRTTAEELHEEGLALRARAVMAGAVPTDAVWEDYQREKRAREKAFAARHNRGSFDEIFRDGLVDLYEAFKEEEKPFSAAFAAPFEAVQQSNATAGRLVTEFRTMLGRASEIRLVAKDLEQAQEHLALISAHLHICMEEYEAALVAAPELPLPALREMLDAENPLALALTLLRHGRTRSRRPVTRRITRTPSWPTSTSSSATASPSRTITYTRQSARSRTWRRPAPPWRRTTSVSWTFGQRRSSPHYQACGSFHAGLIRCIII